jgi:hypothetical protein
MLSPCLEKGPLSSGPLVTLQGTAPKQKLCQSGHAKTLLQSGQQHRGTQGLAHFQD